MPKKPTLTIPGDHTDAIDDDTFNELTVDEERLNEALENPQTIRTGTALLEQNPNTVQSAEQNPWYCYPQIGGVPPMKR